MSVSGDLIKISAIILSLSIVPQIHKLHVLKNAVSMSQTFANIRILGFLLYVIAFVLEHRYIIALTYTIPLLLSVYLEVLIVILNRRSKQDQAIS